MARFTRDHTFFSTTTGRILTLLRRQKQTVDDLAATLSLSDNAVRNQIYSLERDGLVTVDGTRRGSGKPAWVYGLSPEADRLFPKPYALILDHLLDAMDERMPAAEVQATLEDVGRRMADAVGPLPEDETAMFAAVVSAFADIGGLAEIETLDDGHAIQGFDCPMSRTVSGHPHACQILQSMLETLLDRPVTEACDRSSSPRCRFLVGQRVAVDGAG